MIDPTHPVMGLLVKVTLLFVAGPATAALLQRRSAAARHLVWLLTLSGAVALAVVTPVAPVLPFRIAGWTRPTTVPLAGVATAPEPANAGERSGVRATAERATPALASSGSRSRIFRGWEARDTLLAVWIIGVLAVAGRYVLGHVGLARLSSRAAPLSSPEWRSLLESEVRQNGLTAHARLLRSPEVGSPVTWGMRRPTVLLPDDAESWPAERGRVVLAHELAHAARGDALAQLVACGACALYWFHPLAWVAARRLRTESEHACDDQVLSGGTPGAEYAAHLLDVARESRMMQVGGLVAIGMARRSQIEGRLLAVLDATCPRQAPPSRVRTVAWAGLALVVLPLGALRPVPATRAMAGPIPNVRSSELAAPATAVPANSPVLPEASSPAERHREEGSSAVDQAVAASPGGELRIDLESGGAVSIVGSDESRVRVHGTLSGADAADTRVTLEGDGAGVRLRSWQAMRRSRSSTSHAFEIQVPRRFDLRIDSAGGEITIVGVEGAFRGQTGGGSLTIEKSSGSTSLATGGGDIQVSDSDLRGSVSTGGGMVRFSRVRGGLRGSSGSGPVVASDGGEGETGDLRGVTVDREGIHVQDSKGGGRTGLLHIEKAGGDIVLDAAPAGADLTTGGGRIRVGRSSGPVNASTGGGSIHIGPVSGSVRAGTGAGDVQITVVGGDGEQSVEVHSGSGSAVIELPADLSARFDLETAYTKSFGRPTRIESDWDLEREETTRSDDPSWDDRHGSPRKYVRARGQVGRGGGLIRVRIVNGDITIRRGR